MFFEGTVEDGIKQVQQLQLCLLTFIYDDGSVSKKYEEYLHSNELKCLIQENLVCMKFEASSNSAIQFSAYYPVVRVPTVYLISPSGVSLEVIIVDCTLDEFKAKLEKALSLHSVEKKPVVSSDAGAMASSTSDDSGEDWDARVSSMEEKLEKARTAKEKERIEKEKKDEVERRDAGKSLGKMRQMQLEMEEKERIEEVRKERMAKYKMQQAKKLEQQTQNTSAAAVSESVSNVEQQSEVDIQNIRDSKKQEYYSKKTSVSEEKRKADEARIAAELEAQRKTEEERMKRAKIQFRRADGRVFVRDVSSDLTLSSLYDSISDECGERSGYRLATVYPRRIFTEDDMDATMMDLELSPSASLLILPPLSTRQGPVVNSSSILGDLVRLILLPFALLGRLIQFIMPSSSTQSNSSNNEGTSSSTIPKPSSSTSSPSANASTNRRSTGNTMRLHNLPRDDDKDNAVWNGNSTQQM